MGSSILNLEYQQVHPMGGSLGCNPPILFSLLKEEIVRPATVLVRKTFELDGVDYEIMVVQHPEGVECVFEDRQCSCGKLNIGVVE